MSQKYREFSVEFKLKAVERVASGCKVQPLARELGVRRQLLYRWKATFEARGLAGLQPQKRGPKPGGRVVNASGAPPGDPPPGSSEVATLRARVEELERLAGRQAMELDFFGQALREVGAPQLGQPSSGGTASTPSSEAGRARKAAPKAD
ncbi:MAG: helix-turn-helix domain-containing protein [Rhodospirillaceae bacterium]|jgi:transposase-like protein|nr:helix-turn-helix domain-containing protein [Rhodospirillaceae bacterium]